MIRKRLKITLKIPNKEEWYKVRIRREKRGKSKEEENRMRINEKGRVGLEDENP